MHTGFLWEDLRERGNLEDVYRVLLVRFEGKRQFGRPPTFFHVGNCVLLGCYAASSGNSLPRVPDPSR